VRTARRILIALTLVCAAGGCAQSSAIRYERLLSSTLAPQPGPDARIALAFGLERQPATEVRLAAVAE